MSPFSQARAVNQSYSPPSIPTAVFVGGTSGIGEAMASTFARMTKGNANIIIVGRNRDAADRIISSFPKPTPDKGVKHEFIQCDVSLLKNVHATTSYMLSRLDKINFLVISPGYINLTGRNETVEGNDHRLSVMYYARWAFIDDLIPLLQKARGAGEEAKVMSVLAAASPAGVPANVNDLAMKENYGLLAATGGIATYNDLMLEVRLS
jgi:NAD(P)-dependent dehydrogenase (short-subunit alcohol dehydrogenase family)